MKRCIIITAYIAGSIRRIADPGPEDFILCADGGYHLAQKEGLRPNVVIADFDSMPVTEPDCDELIRVPVEKDDTDTSLCLKYAMDAGYRDILIVGGIGGRLDHTYANLQLLALACERGCRVVMADEQNRAFMLQNGTTVIPRQEGYKYSIFAYSPRCTGVSETGCQYPLDHVVLTDRFPLGVSNEFAGEAVTLSVEEGTLLVILSRDL